MIVLFTRLLQAGSKFTNALTSLVNSILTGLLVVANMSDANIEALRRWWQSAPQEQSQQALPPLSKEAEALFFQVQQLMDTQQQIDVLKRYVLTLPALPEEGY